MNQRNIKEHLVTGGGSSCVVCKSVDLRYRELNHKILGDSKLLSCQFCGHQFFEPKVISKEDREYPKKEKNFSIRYSALQSHNDKLISTIKKRRYFIDYSRFILLSHYKYFSDRMRILEIGPGFPGLFQHFKLTKNKFDFYSSESNLQSQELLKKYGVKNISNYFPNQEFSKYTNFFDIIVACNVVYYFNNPILSFKAMLEILKDDGIILIDILNDKMVNDDYLAVNTMTNIFSKKSLEVTIEKAGGEVKFMNTCCVKDSGSAFNNIGAQRNSILKKIFHKIINCFGYANYNEIMSYFAEATPLKYGNNEGQYIRAIISRSKK